MGVIHAMGNIGENVFSLIFKLILFMIVLAFGMIAVIMLVAAWPFTISLLVGLLLCETFYKKLSEATKVKLPDYFYVNIDDFLTTFNEGDEEAAQIRNELDLKREKAEADVIVMREALRSAEEQVEQIKARRSLKTLFKTQPSEISERAAKALEMELNKPRWSQYLEKSRQDESEWENLFA